MFNEKNDDGIYVLPEFGVNSLSLGLGCLGMPGNTAYFGTMDICKPKAGDVVVVSGAAGAVGTIAGQICKIKGCTVIGIAGGDNKCEWLTNVLGFDYAINYKSTNVAEELRKAAPDGVNCYFDNVGGELSATVIKQMNDFGRIAVCGAVSTYNVPEDQWPLVPILQPVFVRRKLVMEGFMVRCLLHRRQEAFRQLWQWVQQGLMKCHETITDGFENMPQALIGMLRGENTGKAIVKI